MLIILIVMVALSLILNIACFYRDYGNMTDLHKYSSMADRIASGVATETEMRTIWQAFAAFLFLKEIEGGGSDDAVLLARNMISTFHNEYRSGTLTNSISYDSAVMLHEALKAKKGASDEY